MTGTIEAPTRRPAGPPPVRPAAQVHPSERTERRQQPARRREPLVAERIERLAVSAPPGVDPRIVFRRVAVLRSAGRRRLRRLIAALSVLTIVALAVGATRTPLLDVDRVEVAGTVETDPAAVLAAGGAAGLAPGAAMVGLDAAAARRSVAALPWVRDVAIERHWPGTVRIVVDERVAVAVVAVAVAAGLAPEWDLVAGDGSIVERSAVRPLGLVELLGAQPVDGMLDAPDALVVAAALPTSVRAAVSGVTAGAEPGTVDLLLADGGRVELGTVTDLPAKLVAVATVLEQVDLTCLGELDVRVPSAPTLTREASCG